jgi:uncharacterized membrane protein
MDFIENIIDENRVLSFSDSVFAFAATLLVLKIDFPTIDASLGSAELGKALISLWPTYFANIISFFVIGYYWLSHHTVFGLLRKFDKGIVWMNIAFLVLLSFLPFPVDLFGEYPNEPTVLIFYSVSIAITGLFLSLIWLYAKRRNLQKVNLNKKQMNYYSLQLLVAPSVFLISIPLVVIDPVLSQFSWLLVLVGIFLVDRFFRYRGEIKTSHPR